MDRRRGLGLVLLLAALVGGVAMAFANPLPTSYEQWSCCGGEGAVLMVARGPAIAHYNVTLDATLAVFECAHHYCRVATQIAGNVTSQLDGAQTLLFSPRGVPAEGEVDLSEPIPIPAGLSPASNVTTMTAARFEVGRAYVPLLMDQALLVLGIAGLLLFGGRSGGQVLSGMLGGAVGLFLGAQLAARGPAVAVLPPVLLVLAAIGAVGAWIVARKRPGAWIVATFLLGLAAALFFSGIVTERFFAHDPMD